MKNKYSVQGITAPAVIGIIAVILVILGVVSFGGKPRGEKAPSQEQKGDVMMDKNNEGTIKGNGPTMEKSGDAMMKEGEDGMMTKYSGSVLAGTKAPLLDFVKSDYDAALKTDTLIVLYFYANWCPICKAEIPKLYAAFNELATDKVIGFRVNYNDDETDADEKSLARAFGVGYQHTKVFVKNGERILKSPPEEWDKARYISEINKALQ